MVRKNHNKSKGAAVKPLRRLSWTLMSAHLRKLDLPACYKVKGLVLCLKLSGLDLALWMSEAHTETST